MRVKRTAIVCGSVAAFVGIAVTSAFYLREKARPPVLEIYIMSLKVGHSIFIRTPSDFRIVIGGGGNAQIANEIAQILPFYSKRIDLIVVSDEDKNSLNGLIEIVRRFDIGKMVTPEFTSSLGLEDSALIIEVLIGEAEKMKIPLETYEKGTVLHSESNRLLNLQIEALFPDNPQNFQYSKTSAPELVFGLSYGSVHLLSIGKTTKKIQKYVASTSSQQWDSYSTKALIVQNAGSAALLDHSLIEKYRPNYLVYSKTSSSRSSPSVYAEHLLNSKEKRIHLLTDGSFLKIGE